MTWGTANELLTMNGYRLLADQCGHPMLAQILRRIADQESRHYSFYLLQAQWRLASSWLARSVLPRFFTGGLDTGRCRCGLQDARGGSACARRPPRAARGPPGHRPHGPAVRLAPGFGGLRIFRAASAAH